MRTSGRRLASRSRLISPPPASNQRRKPCSEPASSRWYCSARASSSSIGSEASRPSRSSSCRGRARGRAPGRRNRTAWCSRRAPASATAVRARRRRRARARARAARCQRWPLRFQARVKSWSSSSPISGDFSRQARLRSSCGNSTKRAMASRSWIASSSPRFRRSTPATSTARASARAPGRSRTRCAGAPAP